MHTRIKLIATVTTTAAGVAAALLLSAPPAGAEGWNPGSSGGNAHGGGFSAWSYWASVDEDGNSSHETVPCTFPAVYNIPEPGHIEYVLYDMGDGTGVVYEDCIGNGGPHITPSTFPPLWSPTGHWDVTIGDPQELIRQALAVIYPTPPAVGTSPTPALNSMVGIETWLWLEGGASPATQTITDGPLSVTVRATPVGITWDPGDGGAVECSDGGANIGIADTNTCHHTYDQSSAGLGGDAYTVSANVEYEGSYTVTLFGVFAGGSPNIGGATRVSSVALPVAEAQAINNRG
jgi:hypothetical protein